MLALSNFFERRTVAANLLLAGAAFSLPVITGAAGDAALSLLITLPAIVALAVLWGVVADRIGAVRERERERSCQRATIDALSTALTASDRYTGTHAQQTLWYVRDVCEELVDSVKVREYVADVAVLHDIGKIGIPDEILHAPGKLDERQWKVMKQHPVIGERIVATVPGLQEVARAIRHEHEHWDGGGYPDGLRQDEIPLASRIVLVCDALHAMTSDRSYRAAMTLEQARMELASNAGTQFDPTVVGALLQVLDRRPLDQMPPVAVFNDSGELVVGEA
ncbi:MAG: HD-GYP domain-containing protein [Thermoleophilia bacterium]|nr:HD-GYP domain-containing protein [Thermoleophilia bacterium]